MTNSYTLRSRPNLYDLMVMEGILNGGGIKPIVTREAYWTHPPPDKDNLMNAETLIWMDIPTFKSLDE